MSEISLLLHPVSYKVLLILSLQSFWVSPFFLTLEQLPGSDLDRCVLLHLLQPSSSSSSFHDQQAPHRCQRLSSSVSTLIATPVSGMLFSHPAAIILGKPSSISLLITLLSPRGSVDCPPPSLCHPAPHHQRWAEDPGHLDPSAAGPGTGPRLRSECEWLSEVFPGAFC